jgi:hypothetical protein
LKIFNVNEGFPNKETCSLKAEFLNIFFKKSFWLRKPPRLKTEPPILVETIIEHRVIGVGRGWGGGGCKKIQHRTPRANFQKVVYKNAKKNAKNNRILFFINYPETPMLTSSIDE